MEVSLLAHTQLSETFRKKIKQELDQLKELNSNPTDGQVIALSAIRNCYSSTYPSEIFIKENKKYFSRKASDGERGSDAERLFRQIVHSGHLSTMEHLNFTFSIHDVSRALLAQLTRHRVGFSFSVESQRYTRLGSKDKSGGFNYVIPPSIEKAGADAVSIFESTMRVLQDNYDALREKGVPPEDSRSVLPNAAVTNIVMTANLRALLDFYEKRRHGHGAQWEIADMAEELRRCVIEVEPWTNQFFASEDKQ
ncbi:FAD-dependent thymidylate synthase [Sporolactobacillus laevolacticus]|uniref:FAD-dependent thymidylate synthase n=1 Tax=Sporolactobacillus laevolacticus TaxID=33018 RepID=UPI0025B3072F|nr:FAD-dependent thymidylate synthase [Sporolactobacillus laevolacticus]MDN3956311.1 FAD-dependent thymidylate synthase [Sporolactobacillus laevolacticus]